jgi:hypothetical protein
MKMKNTTQNSVLVLNGVGIDNRSVVSIINLPSIILLGIIIILSLLGILITVLG